MKVKDAWQWFQGIIGFPRLPISFHYVGQHKMLELELFIYYIQVEYTLSYTAADYIQVEYTLSYTAADYIQVEYTLSYTAADYIPVEYTLSYTAADYIPVEYTLSYTAADCHPVTYRAHAAPSTAERKWLAG